MNVHPEWITLAGTLAIIAFLWSLHKDMRSLSDCVSRLEGMVETLVQVLIGRETNSSQHGSR